eukprot:s2160_g4.t2
MGTALPRENSIHRGIIVCTKEYGAFVQLGKGEKYKDGFLHIGCLPAPPGVERLEVVNSVVREGDKVWVKVRDVDEESGKYALDMRQQAAGQAVAEIVAIVLSRGDHLALAKREAHEALAEPVQTVEPRIGTDLNADTKLLQLLLARFQQDDHGRARLDGLLKEFCQAGAGDGRDLDPFNGRGRVPADVGWVFPKQQLKHIQAASAVISAQNTGFGSDFAWKDAEEEREEALKRMQVESSDESGSAEMTKKAKKVKKKLEKQKKKLEQLKQLSEQKEPLNATHLDSVHG